MSTDDQRARYASVTAGARIFALVVLAPPIAVSQDYDVVVNALLLAAVWTAAVFAEGIRRIPVMPALVVESSLVVLIACLALASSPILLVALVVPPFIGGLVRGRRGVLEVVGAEAVISVAAVLPNGDIGNTPAVAAQLFVWLMVGLGVGLVAALVHRLRSDDAATTSYRDARNLLIELRDLSEELEAGLDPVTIGERLLERARDEVPLIGAVVYAPTSVGFTPLVEGDVADDGLDNAHVLELCQRTGAPVVDGPWLAFPLVTDAGVVAVVVGGRATDGRPTSHIRDELRALTQTLRPYALRLDTALLFASVRDDATAGERRRLARELHDGVAQDLASLGYLIDDLAETATSEEQSQHCDQLRSELGRVVMELRRSLFVLRNEADDHTSLGEAIRALAAHLESRSGIRLAVSVTEGPRRLRAAVESELLRITQEGMTNAVKHSGARLIEVNVRICAPEAAITVRDDGSGLTEGRDDSHGIHIMQERARHIGAALDLRNREDGAGTELRVVLASGSHHEGSDHILEGTAP